MGVAFSPMEESLLEYVVKRLQSLKGSWPKVAAGSGVPLRTVEKVANGQSKNPQFQTVDRLARYLRETSA